MNYWLMKSEPDVYSIADLQRDRETLWDGVRNYQARNYLKSMQPGDIGFFYHSNTAPPGIAGLMRVAQPNVVDPTQFDANSKYYDTKSTQANPRWHTVTVEYVETFPQLISLETLRQTFSPDDLWVVRQGNRLSVMPVPDAIANKILKIGRGI
ncbi:MAG: EVE domain-containing protein [Leptolyngbyaceae cyanobacterium bins.302]|nr:EVE domain-containing protein [Leptolyngbyaceae cyanobacterium bins.302]